MHKDEPSCAPKVDSRIAAPAADAGCVGFAVWSKLRAEESATLLALKFFETHSLTLWCGWSIGSEQQCSLHGGGDSTSDEAVEPVVVGLFGAGFPFVDGSAAAFGADEVLGGDLLGEHAVLVGAIAEDGEAASVAHRDCKPGVREGLPPVRVVDDVADGSLSMDRGDSPVEPDAIAWSAFVFAEWV